LAAWPKDRTRSPVGSGLLGGWWLPPPLPLPDAISVREAPYLVDEALPCQDALQRVWQMRRVIRMEGDPTVVGFTVLGFRVMGLGFGVGDLGFEI